MNNSRATRTATLLLALILTSILLSQGTSAYDAIVQTTTSQLPYHTTTTLEIQGDINETIQLNYDNWLFGPEEIHIVDPLYELEVQADIPEGTQAGNYTRSIFLERNESQEQKTIIFIITDTDQDQDGYSPPQDCNDTDPTVNPGRNEIHYNGKDDDCNPQTPDNFPFSIELSSHDINIGQSLDLRIHAINQSQLTIEICEQGQGFVPCYSPITLPESTYPLTLRLPYTNESGTYTITGTMNYQGTLKIYETAYVIQNSIQATIDADTTKDINEAFTIKITAGGGIPPYTYLWKIPEKADFTGTELNVTYSTAGERTINITIKDKEHNTLNTSVTLNVKKTYPILITTTDNNTGAKIPDATITVKNKEYRTDSNGEARMQISQGTHTFSVIKQGYDIENVRYTIDKETEFTIKLFKKDTAPPIIGITSPQNNSITAQATIQFTITDESPTTCELYLGKTEDALLMQRDKTTYPGTGTYTLNLDIPPSGYKWRIHCEDTRGNTARTGLSFFTVNTNAQSTVSQTETTIENPEENINLIDALYDALDRQKSFSFKEQEAAEIIRFSSVINDALKTIERANRDINDLKYRVDLSDNEKTEKSKEYQKKINDLYSNTPINIAVIDDKNFVKYPSDEQLKAIMDEQYEKYSTAYFNLIKEYQQKISAQTRAMHITLEYIDGSTKKSTLISKKFKNPNITQEDTLIETIPPEIANNQEIIFKQNSIRLKNGIYQVELEEDTLTYQIEKIIPLENTEQFLTIITNKKFVPDMKLPTGFATISLSNSFNLRNILILILTTLIIAYVLHTTDAAQYLMKKDKKHAYAKVIMTDIQDQALAGNTAEARTLYKDLENIYNELSESTQRELYAPLQQLATLLDRQELLERIAQCRDSLETGETGLAIAKYQDMKGLFDILPQEEQSAVFNEVVSLHNELQGLLND